MGRWMEKIRNGTEPNTSKPPNPSFDGFEVIPPPFVQKNKGANNRLTPQQVDWIFAVAQLLEYSPTYLLAHDFIDQYDLAEQHDTRPAFAAHLIHSHPRWPPPKEPEGPAIEPHDDELQHLHRNAANVPSEWRIARDLYIGHLMTCRSCYAATGHFCATGADLRDRYNVTPPDAFMEACRPA